VTIDLDGVAVYDLAVETLGEVEGKVRLAGTGGADDGDQRVRRHVQRTA
jgi:hypothetical protein